MVVFRHAGEATTVGALWQACARAAGAGAGIDLLLAAARLECGCADAGHGAGHEDGAGSLIEFTIRTARFYLGIGPRPGRTALRTVAQALPAATTVVRLSALEGVRFYALDPAGYAAAARRWWRDRKDTTDVWVIGLRSMGSVLAPVVAAAVAERGGHVGCVTVRPEGAADQRTVRFSRTLRERWQREQGEFILVDEGPGLSGSSFGGTVAALRGMGIALERIHLIPAWSPEPARLSNPYAARHWAEWSVYVPPEAAPPAEHAHDASGGQWRHLLGRHANEPVWPQHERRKFISAGALFKFAGFGGYGRATLARAEALAAQGWGPKLAAGGGDLSRGWIAYQRTPCAPVRRAGRAWCTFVGRYLAWVAANFRLELKGQPSAELREMVAANCPATPEAPEGPVMALDGRMLACEWGETERGYVKFDGTDHGDDPFFPGPADIAWDLAAVGVEFGRARGEAVVAEYCRASGETQAVLGPRLRWHQMAYVAFRRAYCELAAAQTALPDREGFRRQARAYASCLDRRDQ